MKLERETDQALSSPDVGLTSTENSRRPLPDHPEANLALGWLGELYEIDERAEGGLEKKAALRRTESAQMLAKLKTWLWSCRRSPDPASDR